MYSETKMISIHLKTVFCNRHSFLGVYCQISNGNILSHDNFVKKYTLECTNNEFNSLKGNFHIFKVSNY